MEIPIVENVLKLNDEIAALNRRQFNEAGLLVLDLIGAPGCGKTALLEATLRHLRGRLRLGVIVGDLATARDAARLARWSEHVVQVNTGRGCHLDANQVRQAAARLELSALDVLVIENVGNLICPVGFDLGQHLKIGMFSAADGDDKAAKHPYLVTESALLLLNKTDLLPHVNFDRDLFFADIHRLNPDATMLELSARRDHVQPWLTWLERQAETAATTPEPRPAAQQGG